MVLVRSVPQEILEFSSSPSPSRFKLFQKELFSIGVEILLPLAFFTLLSIFFDDGHRFINISPHPFWLVLLPVTVHRGTWRGVICAFFCSLFLLVGNVPLQKDTQNLYEYAFEVLYNPLMWFAASFILGEITLRHLQKNKDLLEKVEEANQRNFIFQKAFRNLKKIKKTLEIRLATEFRTPSASLRVASHLIELTPEKVIENFVTAIENLVKPEQFSIYIREIDTLTVVYTHGWTQDASYLDVFAESSPLFQWVIQDKKEVCVMDTMGEKILDHQGVYALPLVNPRTEEAFGILKIEKLAFHDLNLSTLEIIRELVHCACQAYILALEILKTSQKSSNYEPI